MKAQVDLSTMSRAEILERYAPIFHMGVNTRSGYYDGQDLILAVDHDANWGTYDDDEDVLAPDSNWGKTTCAGDIGTFNGNDVTPVVYSSMKELVDFYILSYNIYHTYNEIEGAIGDHLNDMEGVTLIVSKDGSIKGASTIVHNTRCWATPWSTDEEPDIFDKYASTTYKLHLSGTHPEFWIGSNGMADLIFMTHGHAIFPFSSQMDSRGVSYSLGTTAEKPSFVGEKSGTSYTSKCQYTLAPIEELFVKCQMGTEFDKMYQLGQNMWDWGTQFWGNGWVFYASDSDVRTRYNDSYGGPDVSYSYSYAPDNSIGKYNPKWIEETIGSIEMANANRSFYKERYAILPGGGCISKSNGQDRLAINRTHVKVNPSNETTFSIEAAVKRVGKIHLNSGFYSNPEGLSYVNGTGPTGGIMLRKDLTTGSDFLYLAFAPETQKIYQIKRSSTVTGGQTVVNSLNRPALCRHFRVESTSDGLIKFYSKNLTQPNDSWTFLCEFVAADYGLDGDFYGSLLTQSDVDSWKKFYWTNAEYDKIVVNGTSDPTLIERAYYKIEAKHSGKVLDVSGKSLNNSANIAQWEYHGAYNQQWLVESVGNDEYKIVSRHSGKALDVNGESKDNKANIIQYDYSGTNNQKWQIVPVDKDYVKIISVNSGKALDVTDASMDNGANVVQYDFGAYNDNQQWKLVKVGSSLKSRQTYLGTVEDEQEIINNLIVYPNPVTQGNIHVKFNATTPEASQIKIYSASGKVILTKAVQVVHGANNLNINLPGVISGIYFLEVQTSQKRFVERVNVK
jgi:hypothetical protein